MSKKIQLIFLSVLLLAGTAAQAQQATSLKDMPPIMHKWLMRGHRIELVPVLGITLNDVYTRSLFLQVKGAYHFNDWLGVVLEFSYGAPLKTALASDIESEVSKASGSTYTLSRTYLNILAVPYVSFTPFSGKLVVFDKYLGYADIHFDLGAGMAYVGAYTGTNGTLGSKTTWTAMFGVGMRYFPIKGLSVMISLHDYLVPRALSTSKSGSFSEELTNNLAVLFGVGFYFPRVPKRTK